METFALLSFLGVVYVITSIIDNGFQKKYESMNRKIEKMKYDQGNK